MAVKVLMRCWGLADGRPCAVDGQWLKSFDPDSFGGRGDAGWTSDPTKAIRFADLDEASEFWRKQSTVKPRREDGQPNRPLTAFNVTFDTVPE